MSVRLLTEVWETAPVKGGQLLVLLAMADYCNDQGMCWPSVRSLAKKSRLSESQVQRVLRGLEKAKLITSKGVAEGYGTTRYRVHLAGGGRILRGVAPMRPYPSYPSTTDLPNNILEMTDNSLGPQNADPEAQWLADRYRRGRQ